MTTSICHTAFQETSWQTQWYPRHQVEPIYWSYPETVFHGIMVTRKLQVMWPMPGNGTLFTQVSGSKWQEKGGGGAGREEQGGRRFIGQITTQAASCSRSWCVCWPKNQEPKRDFPEEAKEPASPGSVFILPMSPGTKWCLLMFPRAPYTICWPKHINSMFNVCISVYIKYTLTAYSYCDLWSINTFICLIPTNCIDNM